MTLQDLLIIVTGAGEVPLLGFDVQPSLGFRHEQDLLLEESHTKGLPRFNTCSNKLSVPILPSYKLFKNRMLECIKHMQCFTNT